MRCEPLERRHWEAVQSIYEEGIAGGLATFATEAPDWCTWDRSHTPEPRRVAIEGSRVVGWAALSPVSDRRVYGGVAEVSVYVAEQARGQGVGRALLADLIRESERAGYWTLEASIFVENVTSMKLHRACGFRAVGVRERLGALRGVWRDVMLMERRSRVVGL